MKDSDISQLLHYLRIVLGYSPKSRTYIMGAITDFKQIRYGKVSISNNDYDFIDAASLLPHQDKTKYLLEYLTKCFTMDRSHLGYKKLEPLPVNILIHNKLLGIGANAMIFFHYPQKYFFLMDEGNFNSFKKLLFDNALGNIESSPHADKQRRWHAKKKDQHHRTQLSLHRLLVEQIHESHQYSSDINENFENDVTVDNRIFDDNMVVHDSAMDDTHSDVTCAGGTFNDDTLVHDYILDDDDYNYSFDFNPNSVQSAEIIAEQEDEPLHTGAPVAFKSYHKQILEFGNSVKLSDSNMNKLLQLIGNALPIENKLLRSYKKLLTAFKIASTFNQEL
ncbi:unnamed protein product [Rotaria sp. Silwood2]|nr:unnamed protein product [Rotaria sp. Silwood2]CAF3414542.1 unnamed protein product [Rotaria sp. Silwood2]